MALFDVFKKKNNEPKSTVPYVDKNSARYELEMKARSGKSMSAEEYASLQRYRTRDVWDQVFRIAGVITVLAIILLAVFIFLYPYSVFNVFPTSAGKGDVFWKMLGNWHVYVGKTPFVYNDEGTVIGGTWLGTQADEYGYVVMSRIFDCAFQSEHGGGASGFDFKCGVYVIGSWTIVVVATIGFVAAIVGASFILASNIKNLIGVIRHVGKKTGETFSNLGTTAKESYEEAVPEAKEKKTKTTRKKKEEPKVVPAEEEPVANEEDDEADFSKRVAELKEEIAEEEVAKEQAKVVPITEAPKKEPVKSVHAEEKKSTSKYDSLGDEDLDRLLGGK